MTKRLVVVAFGLFAALSANAQSGGFQDFGGSSRNSGGSSRNLDGSFQNSGGSFQDFDGGNGFMQGPPPMGGNNGKHRDGQRPMGPPPNMNGQQQGMPPMGMHHQQSFGTNAAVLSLKGGHTEIPGGTLVTDTVNANAVVADGGLISIENALIHCKQNMSRGLYAVNGGTIAARNLSITTEGNNSSVIATDRGGGTVTVTGGSYTAKGKDCAVCYSTGSISVQGITGLSEQGEAGVIEGDNVLNMTDATLTSGCKERGFLLLQSGSGDAKGYNARLNINRGSITLTQPDAPLVEVTTNTSGTVVLKDVELNVPSGILMRVDYNKRWQTKGATGNLRLATASAHTYNGCVTTDRSGTANVTVDSGVTWNLTGDTNVNTLVIHKNAVINTNGHQLKYKSLDNKGVMN